MSNIERNEQGDYRSWDDQFPVPVTQTVETTREVTRQDEVTAMQSMMQKFFDYALEGTDLAKRVKALTEQVAELRQQVGELQQALKSEQAAHAETRSALQSVQETLNHREMTIKDLVAERDIVVRERDEARQDRDSAKQEIARWSQAHDEVFGKLTQREQEVQKLQEQLDAALGKINAFRTAFGGLAA